MNDNITAPTRADVGAFLGSVEPAVRREDAYVLDELFRRVTGEKPVMWGASMIGYGSYHYSYESGRKGEWLRTGFSPRKAKHSIYLIGSDCDEDASAQTQNSLKELGAHSIGRSCLYITRLAQVDMDVLENLVRISWDAMNRRYPPA